MKTYLVTGAAGFIGANYIKYILAKHSDIKVVVLDALTYAGNLGTIAKDIDNERCFFIKGDICSREVVDSLFAEYRFDYVVNFAAESHVDRSIENPQLFLITNILGTQNLLDCARRAWVMGKDEQGYPTWRKGVRYHQVSTDEVYGSLGAEGYFTEETPLCPHSPYSASKTSADMVVMAYHDTYKMPVTITRCSNNYGPYHFPEKLIPLIIKNILEGKHLPVYGDGSNVRDWLYVEDHCKAIDLVVREGKEGEVYNVGGHNEETNLEIVKLTIATIRKLMTEKPEYRQVLKKKVKGEDGEIGLDYYWDKENHDLQKEWFIRQLDLARKKEKPVIIHSREAAADTMEIMKEYASGLRGVIHCYSYSAEMAKEYVKMGYYIGIGGVVTFKNAKKLKQVVQEIPLESIVLETDCPYLAPVPYRGKRNSSLYLPYVAEEIAALKGAAAEDVVLQTEENARKLYGL